MAKMTGIPMTVTVDDGAGTARIITNDVLSVTLDMTRAMADITGVDKLGMERTGLLSDATVSLTGAWNPAVAPTFFWAVENGVQAAVDMELSNHQDAEFRKNLRAVEALLGFSE